MQKSESVIKTGLNDILNLFVEILFFFVFQFFFHYFFDDFRFLHFLVTFWTINRRVGGGGKVKPCFKGVLEHRVARKMHYSRFSPYGMRARHLW